MKAALAKSTGLLPDEIGLKATTNEGVGDLGRGRGRPALLALAPLRLRQLRLGHTGRAGPDIAAAADGVGLALVGNGFPVAE